MQSAAPSSKVVEEAPSPLLDAATRARIGAAACDTARSVDYVGAGTVEFIVSGDRPDEFFFMEMNTRLQVEHPVTEMVTGWDLVEWQVRIAAGERLAAGQDEILTRGHAIEARVYAENPAAGFLPTGGPVLGLIEPVGPGIRVDSGLSPGMVIGSDYDPMLSKVIAHGCDRTDALRVLDRALADTAVLGVTTNVDFLRFVLSDDDVASGSLDTGLLERLDYRPADPGDEALIPPPRLTAGCSAGPPHRPSLADPVRVADRSGRTHHRPAALRGSDRPRPNHRRPERCAGSGRGRARSDAGSRVVATQAHRDPRRRPAHLYRRGGEPRIWLAFDGRAVLVEEVRESPVRPDDDLGGDAEPTSPMPGSVVAVGVSDGEQVEAGTVVVAVEAMKMEHSLRAPVAGVAELLVRVGDQVRSASRWRESL